MVSDLSPPPTSGLSFGYNIPAPASDDMPRRRLRPPQVPRSTIALLFISILLPLILFALAANQNRREVEKEAMQRVDRTTRILHEHAMKVFETHQLVLDQINERLASTDWSEPHEREQVEGLLQHLKALLPQVVNIIVTDADGSVRTSAVGGTSPPLNVADRDYFNALKASPQTIPYISSPIIGRQVGQPIFVMATRVRGPVPGVFDGVIAISVKRGYFNEFYSGIEREFSHVIVLARDDGSILASEPRLVTPQISPAAISLLNNSSEPVRLSIRPTMIDGAKRLFGFERVGAYPVIIGFGITWDSVMAPWWRNMTGYGLVAALSSVVLLGVSGFAIRRVTLEGRATVRWRRTAALLESEMAQRVRIEEQLRQSQKMEAVGRLTGGIAHDFNNLLTVVMGSLDLLSRRLKTSDPRHLALVQNAMDGASRAATLTARLLSFSRQHPLNPDVVDVNELVHNMTNLLQRTLGETIVIQFDLARDLATTWVDPNQLENAILNLCVNAVDAMPKGGALTITTANAIIDETAHHEFLSDGHYVMVSVADTGMGMDAEVLRRAFEPFFTTKPVGKGTGLGLSQVYGFTRQSGGDADIQSVIGVGTTVRLYLPRKAAMAKDQPSPPTFAIGKETVGAPREGMSILIVEDDELVRQFSSATLREAGYTVLEAGTGPDALQTFHEHPEIMLLFTDVVLKGSMNGRELADRILEENPALPVLFTTGYTKDAIVHHGRLDEGVNLIGKPFTPAALSARIADLLAASPIEERQRAVG